MLKDLLIALDRFESDSLSKFVELSWPIIVTNKYRPNWHIDCISDLLEDVSLGKIKKLAISVPPGSTKTLLTSVFWPAWDWIYNRDRKWIYVTYGQKLGLNSSRKLRNLVSSQWYCDRFNNSEPFVVRGTQSTSASFWENVYQGFRFSTSITGEVTGRHADIIIGDDLNKAQDAFGNAELFDKSWETWTSVLPTRAVNQETLARVLIGQRLHSKDVVGRWLTEDSGVVYCCLPLHYSKHHPYCFFQDPREENELLTKDYSQEVIKELEINLGTTVARAQLEQDPQIPEGNLCKTMWLENLWSKKDQLEYCVWSWDLTFKDTGKSYVSGQLWEYTPNKNFYLIHQLRGKWDFLLTKEKILEGLEIYKCPVLIEEKANGAAILSALKNDVKFLIPIVPKESKYARFNSVLPQFESGKIFLPAAGQVIVNNKKIDSNWVHNYRKELLSYSGKPSDDTDQIDATSQAINYIQTNISSGYSQGLRNLVHMAR